MNGSVELKTLKHVLSANHEAGTKNMARPTKQGIDYFPIDCQFDGKIEMYILEKEAAGLAVLVTLWQLIYQDEGYYISDNKDLHLRIKKRINVDINEVNDCINVCLSRQIFDKPMHDKYSILTSKAIQKRFFDAAKRKKILQYEVNYIINGINVCDNAVNVPQQSLKGKGKGKGDIKETKDKHLDFVFLSKNEYHKLIEKFGESLTKNKIDVLNNYLGSKGKKYSSHYHTILVWDNKNKQKEPEKERGLVI